MASRKRSRETDVTVKVAEGVPLEAESFILRTFSSCARELPAAAEEWDISGLIYKDKHFEHATVQCWLHCCYSVVCGAAELQEDDLAQLRDARRLHQVLSFAHAVGSTEGLLSAICRQLDHITVSVQLAQQTLELSIRAVGYCFAQGALWQMDVNQKAQKVVEAPLGEQQQVDVQRQVAQQISALLHMAHVLRLQPLIERLHTFIFWSVTAPNNAPNNLLFGVLKLVFTEEVLDAALGSSTLSKDTYINSVISQPCGPLFQDSPSAGFKGRLFKPIAGSAGTPNHKFKALVLQDFAGLSKGQEVTVQLDLFNSSTMKVGAAGGSTVVMPAQLLLGFTSSSENWDNLMDASQ